MLAATPSDASTPTTPHANLLLTRLMVAFSRRRAYPATHPLVRTAEEQAFETVRAVVGGRHSVAVALTRNGLLVDESPVDSHVARDLSDRLRLRGVGALTIEPTVTADALRDAIAWLASEQSDSATSVDASAAPPSLTGIRITRIDYGKLAIGDTASGDMLSTEDIWRELASGTAEDSEQDDAFDPTQSGGEEDRLVSSVERRLARPDAARTAGSVLLRVADQVTRAHASSRAQLAERLQAVLHTLQASSLKFVMDSRGDSSDKRHFVAQMIDALPQDAIIEWIRAAAQVAGEPLSPQLLRMLSSVLARAKQHGATHDGESAFRTAARELVHGWALDNPHPGEHAELLDRISAFDALRVLADVTDTGAARLVQQALEIDAFSEDAMEAAQQLLAEGRVSELMSWCAATPGQRSADRVRTLLHSKAVVNAVLLRDPIDQQLARSLLSSLDENAVELLLDVLRDAKGRAARRLVLTRLREFGPSIAEILVARLDGTSWYFARNLLTLLRELSGDEHAVASHAELLQQLAAHPQEQVRVEALRLLIAESRTRDAALRRALDDPEERVVKMAIDAIGAADAGVRLRLLPADIWPRVLRVIEAGTYDEDTRAHALRLLGHAPPSSRVRELLLSLATVRSRILRRVALAEPSAVAIAALEALARRYASDATVTDVIERANESTERRHRDAVRAAMSTASA